MIKTSDYKEYAERKIGAKINTHHVYAPIPVRCFDWHAIRDQDEGEETPFRGYGHTECEAIDDLVSQIEEQ